MILHEQTGCDVTRADEHDDPDRHVAAIILLVVEASPTSLARVFGLVPFEHELGPRGPANFPYGNLRPITDRCKCLMLFPREG